MALVKQSEFARLCGVSRKTITTWKVRGWLTFEGDLVDVEASNETLKKYRRDGGALGVTQEETVTQRVTQTVTWPICRWKRAALANGRL
jgi:hypothetical protein